MDVVVTPDVLSFLEFQSATLRDNKRVAVCALFAFSKNYIAVITEEWSESKELSMLEIKTKVGDLKFTVKYDNKVKTEKHWITKYSYKKIDGEEAILRKWNSLLAFRYFQQMRKEERLPINSTTLTELKLKSAAGKIWINNKQQDCVLHDLSYSGARFFCVNDFELNSDEKIILQLSFIDPCEIATIRSVVVRSRCIEIAGMNCNEVAVRFLEPADLVFLERMTVYQKNIQK